MQIEELPDYPAMQQLARSLWHEGTARGAAVLVGAGFSKNAERSAADTPEAPLWSDFAREMAEQLYPNDPRNVPTDPLRLAEEYRTYFGQAALDEFIRIRIRDIAWQPGPLHRDLLNLPWSDILTTNWDTLLERAAHGVSQRHYERVLCEADLAHTRAPRIVKLHGSLGMTEHFIVAEEDYRTYPMRFAAFVNLARQVFIENELCLVGFGGDDPNFLQWSGWVRDKLGGSARRIYLVGVLDLWPAKRKFLEARNVAPIDLGPLVRDEAANERHAVATRIFLDFLANTKPQPAHDWRPAPISAYGFLPKTLVDNQRQFQDAAYAASLLDQAARIWQSDRESYPGWLICPADRRQELRSTTANCQVSQAVLDALPDERRGTILYEIARRHAISLWPIDGQLVQLLATGADPSGSHGLAKQQCLEIALLLLRTARRSDDADAFGRWAQILETHSVPGTDIRAEVAYQRALRARDRLDFPAMEREVGAIDGRDPAWALRRAALLADLGEFAEAGRLVNEALTELERRQRSDRRSLWIRSRRAWAEWLARAVRQDKLLGHDERRWPSEFRDARCDPEDETERIRDEAAAALRKRREDAVSAIPLFEAGHYRDGSGTIHLQSAAAVEPMEALDLLMEAAGLPMRLHYVSFVEAASRDAAELAFEASSRWYVWFLRAIGSPLDSLFGRYFGRVAVALLPPDVALGLSDKAKAAISYWREKTRVRESTFAVDQLRLFLEVLARLTVRQDPAAARANLDLAAQLARDGSISHPWLYEPLGHLASYTIQAIPPASRTAVVLPMLEFPLSGNKESGPFRWPNPIEALWTTDPGRVMGDARWNQCVAQLIEAAKPGSGQRAEAVFRLAYLAKRSALTTAEAEAFGRALWAETDGANAGLPAGTTLLAFAFADLPAPEGIDKESPVRAYLFDCDIKLILSPPVPVGTLQISSQLSRLLAISAAAQGPLRPTPEQATRLFDDIVHWRQPDTSAIDAMRAGLLHSLYAGAPRLLGDALKNMVVPSMAKDDRTQARVRELLIFLREVPGSTAAGGLPYFLNDQEDVQAEIVCGIQQAIAGRTEEEVAGGAAAVATWAMQSANSCSPLPPPQLVDRVTSAIESGREIGMTAMLHCARKLVETGILAEPERSRIANALGDLLNEYNYRTIDPDSRRSVSVSLIRAECVRLCRALENAGGAGAHTTAWLSAATADPLPEVRFALAADCDLSDA